METLAKAAAIVALPAAAWYVLLAPSKPKKKAHRGRKANKKKKEVVAARPRPRRRHPRQHRRRHPTRCASPKAWPPRPKPKPRRPLATTSVPAAFSSGDKVEARFGGGEDYFPATITGSKPLGGGKYSYALAYDDGATETGVSASFIRRVGGASTPATHAERAHTTPSTGARRPRRLLQGRRAGARRAADVARGVADGEAAAARPD